MYFDSSMAVERLGACVVLVPTWGDRMRYLLQIHFSDYNNVAEYEALLHGLRIVASMGIQCLICHGDSDLVVQRVMKTFGRKDSNMPMYCMAVC